ncbi:unnamed protein product, partial [Iphiclides podalirius]
MAEGSRFASRIAAFILIGANLFFMTLCAGTFALGLWAIASPSSLSHAIQTFGDATTKVLLTREFLDVQLGVALAALSMFFFFIALMGFYGAVDRSQFLLFMYSILVVLLLLLECALLFYYTSDLTEKGVRAGDGQLTHALRVTFKCCEHNYSSDASDMMQPPWSCCGVMWFPDNCTADRIFGQDCKQTISAWWTNYRAAVYLSLSALHIVLLSCSLVRRSDNAPPPVGRCNMRVSPASDPDDDLLMIVMGRGRVGWTGKAPAAEAGTVR